MSSSSPPEPAIQTAARLLAEGRPAEAVDRLAALTAETPTYAAAHVLYATALEAAGDIERALGAWAHAGTLVPLSPLVHREHARLLAALAQAAEDPDDLHDDVAGIPDATSATPEAPGPSWDEAEGDPPLPPSELRSPIDDWEGWSMLTDGIGLSPITDEPSEGAPDEGADESDPDRSVSDELDALIAQLEDAPRIRPDPAFDGPAVRLDQDDVDEVASETLAKIYAAQRQYAEAALIYEKLAAREPDRAAELLERAAEMRDRA